MAVTGGIASGKSAVSRRLVERGAVLVDADQLARDVVQPGEPALTQIAEAFGPGVIAEDGGLDRAALGAIIFADETKRILLNSITHPAIVDRARQLFEAAGERDPHAVVVYDIPLLVDGSGRRGEYDLVAVVVADEETRVRRMVELRGMSEADARSRIASQVGDDERVAVADVVIDANGTLDETNAQVDALWEELQARVGGAA